MTTPRPYTVICELTYRCPLQCVYCSNPVEMEAQARELSDKDWQRVLREAAALGVLQAHFTGGEPLLRKGVVDMIRTAREVGLYTNLITSGLSLTPTKLKTLRDAGLDHIQLSIQGADADTAQKVAGVKGHAKKLEVARLIKSAGFPLTLNVVLHRINIHQIDAFIDMAIALGAGRLELANTQFYAWALENRDRLMPTLAQLDVAAEIVQRRRTTLGGKLEIAFVQADYYSDRPKRCMDGWAQRYITVIPSGEVLPCHAARVIPNLTFDNVKDASLGNIWRDSPALNAFRGDAWMQEPCRSCPEKTLDLGGCRCQAFLLTGEAAAADPICTLSPRHHVVDKAKAQAHATAAADTSALVYRHVTTGGSAERLRILKD